MPGAATPFKPLWIDRADADAILQDKLASGRVAPALGERLAFLIKNGYVIIPGAITHGLADQLLAEMAAVTAQPEKFIARRDRAAYAHPTAEVVNDVTFRIIDFHVNSRHAGKAIYCDAIAQVLDAVFEAPANAFQCLTFKHGSQQRMHQDGAYVVVSEPLQFMASWIALEDVTPGSGELMYYAGSHRLDDFLFGDERAKAWTPAVHGREIHARFLDSIVERSEAAGLPRESFLPKKGDALIWASDLVHGGTRMKNDNTRRSIVTHYCPVNVAPKFSTFTDYFHLRKVAPRGYISSRHYDLRRGKRWLARDYPVLKPKFMGGSETQA
ncbi:MAG: phytanoyl-CoA dioxygenase family protein [Halioglobus sp.]